MPIPCTATRKDGRPCRAWAVPGSLPPLCSAHGRRLKVPAAVRVPLPFQRPAAGGTGRAAVITIVPYLAEERAEERAEEPATLPEPANLADELAAVREAVRRIKSLLESSLALEDYAGLVSLLFRGTETVARLLQAQQALSGEAADGLTEALAQVLVELGIEWQVEL